MAEEYYIIENNGSKTGPIDIVSLVKRVRSGKVNAYTEIYRAHYDDTVLAESLEEIKDFFEDDVERSTEEVKQEHVLAVFPILKDAFSFLGSNHTVAMISAGFVLLAMVVSVLIGNILPAILVAPIATLAGGLCYFLNAVFVLRKVRNQTLDGTFVAELLNYHIKPFFMASAVISMITFGIPALIGSVFPAAFLLMILSVIGFTFFAFTPYFMLDDPSLNYKDAIIMSKNWVKSRGTDGIGALVGLLFLNVIGAALFIPLFITLPVTSIALADIYEQHLSN